MNTVSNAVLLAGNSPLYSELKILLESKGYSVLSFEQADEHKHEIRLAIEVNNLDLDIKKSTIKQMDMLLPANVPILTSSLAITATEAASWTEYSERVCGFGTFVPLIERSLIEVAPALQSTPLIVEQVKSFFDVLGKESEIVEDEVGLVFPRILSLIINEAAFAVMEGTATPEDIDIAMKKGTNYPYGPLEWGDRIGLDEVFAVVKGLHRDLAEERYRPAPLLRKLVLADRVGVRSGRGFYSYEKQEVYQP
ncbi:3-hydroxyacyl-CoA dehydrogenase family protein [Aneurinibacillus aneurinilyticus]|jgi:3-hydroxybutyryl-CoA dehydrogenase|uniref:3-hydroxybutyryl-CoA dehydrogenase family protein n=1 Tax=Aneurinibacillus aneurinilyticus ATCC 12856 TaxID=649747 RepID=U1X0T5_ANEAE|nr:3-hydroxyacyl-CoA dehydrogenase family protein [Aneurinibacillus aneurinilyticus]ERI08133.1 3-hydroxybutyryl-CoA dehydrogenase family protein [Aneurinibacillus aneurinilyticus ATCC 12856]MCI1696720.1 3-hydroxyacyl-CoA dehydrogenase family protein [Aneurinibacillus aneurinilyticus]MED0708369.1 3-hydroxyacyl-CoA dehydrogenase family protein [Aneurinibacillus aneurinilyticus]MED0725153.1 3-hydroxyacyl-CoA dehydrogenase family protein [Aneurinibacillus aneurinilyticus]MED0733995.1 3-hydroxyacyl